MNHSINQARAPIALGRYHIQACPLRMPSGGYAPRVSIASGSGCPRTDRIATFAGEFACPLEAASYAEQQGRDWVQGSTRLQ